MPEWRAAAGTRVYPSGTRVINYPGNFLLSDGYPGSEYLICRFHVNKNIKQTYKGSLHFTVICCTNKCIINERYIPEHQNKLNIYDLQNYELFANFFQPKKIRKIR